MTNNLVIIPTYNEKENITSIISAVYSLQEDMDILVIDDGSPDGTADIVTDLMKMYDDCLFLIKREGKLGLGTAYITGFKWALEHGYEYIFEMDAISLIRLRTLFASSKHARMMASIWLSALAISLVSM